MRVFAIVIGCVFAGDAVDEDHMSVLQHKSTESDGASKRRQILDRAGLSSGLSAQLDSAVAGKKGKCNALEAAELVSCLRLGDRSALDVLAAGESFDEASRDAEEAIIRVQAGNTAENVSDGFWCTTLRQDVKCMIENPCYKWKIKNLPLDWQVDGGSRRTKQLCKDHRGKRVFDYFPNTVTNGMDLKKVTWGEICDGNTQNFCNMLLTTPSPHFKNQRESWELCGVTCDPSQTQGTLWNSLEKSVVDASKVKFVLQRRYNAHCDEFHPDKANKSGKLKILTTKDCKTAAENLMVKKNDGVYEKRHYHFKEIRTQKRPRGCYFYKATVFWNKVKTGSGPIGKRLPICSEVA